VKQYSWKDKISNIAQWGGIETSVLDISAGRGTRIAWINTGSGLRYKVVLDRAMDVADAFFNNYCLSWMNETGITPPAFFADKGVDWLRNFGGGLFVTCGLSHIGGPESDEYGERGLHGRISNTPAEIISIQQPDPFRGNMNMSITGLIRETSIFGPRLELRRTVSSKLGEAIIHLQDEVTNNGNQSAPHMLLYHFNFGWPLADEGTDILWQGSWQPRDESSKLIFNENNNFRKCPPVMEEHAGAGEAAAARLSRAGAMGVVVHGGCTPLRRRCPAGSRAAHCRAATRGRVPVAAAARRVARCGGCHATPPRRLRGLSRRSRGGRTPASGRSRAISVR